MREMALPICIGPLDVCGEDSRRRETGGGGTSPGYTLLNVSTSVLGKAYMVSIICPATRPMTRFFPLYVKLETSPPRHGAGARDTLTQRIVELAGKGSSLHTA